MRRTLLSLIAVSWLVAHSARAQDLEVGPEPPPAPVLAPPAPPPETVHFDTRLFWNWGSGLGLANGISLELAARGWFGNSSLVGWSAGTSLGYSAESCSRFVQSCNEDGPPGMAVSFNAGTVGIPFDLLFRLEPAGQVRIVLEVAPGMTYLVGRRDAEPFDATFLTGSAAVGADGAIGPVTLLVRFGGRFAVTELDGSSFAGAVYGPALIGRLGLAVSF